MHLFVLTIDQIIRPYKPAVPWGLCQR